MSANSKVEIVYDYMLSELAQQHYNEGDHLVISRIATNCKTSVIPVREALRRLESDGYVKIDANRGATVVGITKETLKDIAETKGVLEGYATRVAIDYLTPKDIRTLYDINEELHVAAKSNDDTAYSEKNKLFHHFIYEHVPNIVLKNQIEKLLEKYNFTAWVFNATPQRMVASYGEHLEILRLIEERKSDELEIYVRNHKMNAISQWAQELS